MNDNNAIKMHSKQQKLAAYIYTQWKWKLGNT